MLGNNNPLKRTFKFLCLTAEPGSVCAGLPKKPRPAPLTPPPPTTTTQSPTSSKSGFLCLPAELRNQIYSHALVQQTPIILPYAYESRSSSSSFKSRSISNSNSEEPPLLSTSRAIRAEATSIYYGCNSFEAPSHASAYKFLKRLSFAKIQGLRMFRPVTLVLPQSAHTRWVESVRRSVNTLVKEVGKGALAVEAVCVPVRRVGTGDLGWVGLREAGFVVKRDEGSAGYWRIEDGEGIMEEGL
ncbi:uncharacterized protein SEPMUDRAFT_151426 [Sphaerulina musiva SO2202]|uniref:2EXR domain-containing protein n=1 Tax=Sphaerulina musiva (strain SO2202) TaxID=692275 RepID=N1QFT9_SPHMS|nr:uncharacterized protein SEPMUDRAFT_151426 [Sphaerulina musiva SO2202]EMF09388.1 hypothetical protein SEPMUDRAFT_151426 [Sphaerulina musiva SO2202]